MERVDGWADKLEKYLLGRHEQKFVWGESDCCLFVADTIQVLTGVDVGTYFRGKYDRILPAYALMKDYSNGGSIQETWEKIAANHGMKPIYNIFYKGLFPPILVARKDILPGDLVTMKVEQYCNPVAARLANGITVGIQSFTQGILSQGKDGLVLSTEPEIISAWKI